MAPVKINPDKIRAFKDVESFCKWLSRHHDKEDEIWIKIHKVDSGLKWVTPEARDCCRAGWCAIIIANAAVTVSFDARLDIHRVRRGAGQSCSATAFPALDQEPETARK